MSYTIGVTSTRGIGPDRGGRQRNEDNYLVCHLGEASFLRDGTVIKETREGSGSLVAVCDGMGGHQAGDLASFTAARALTRLYQKELPSAPARAMLRFVKETHNQLHWKIRELGEVKLGTTLTACWIIHGHAAWVHVGDSRLYLIRDSDAFQLTPDHTRNEFFTRDGKSNVAGGDHLAQSYIYGSRGLGDDAGLRLEYGLDASIEKLHAGDRLVLCSDGFSGVVDVEAMKSILAQHSNSQDASNACVERAINEGSTDNITVAVISIPKHAAFDDLPDNINLDDEWEEESTVLF